MEGLSPKTAILYASGASIIISIGLFLASIFSDPDLFLGFLNIFAAITSILWVQYTLQGGGNDNAIRLFLVLFFLNCLGIILIFIRRRLLWKKGLLDNPTENDTNNNSSSVEMNKNNKIKNN